MTKALTTIVLTALLGVGTFALTAGSASAEVVCNNEGDCWHVKDHVTYPSGVTIQVHPDDWKWGDKDKYRWHEPQNQNHGFWRGGVWIGF
jgi:hypothetical protein